MNISASITTPYGDEYRIGLSSVEESLIDDDIYQLLKHEQIEIVEIYLERIKGKRKATPRILTEISELIAQFFMDNAQSILYYYCDDMISIPNTEKNIPPQEYRSRLFSKMFERYQSQHPNLSIHDIPVYIDAVGWPIYLHFITHEKNMKYVEMLSNDILSHYSK